MNTPLHDHIRTLITDAGATRTGDCASADRSTLLRLWWDGASATDRREAYFGFDVDSEVTDLLRDSLVMAWRHSLDGDAPELKEYLRMRFSLTWRFIESQIDDAFDSVLADLADEAIRAAEGDPDAEYEAFRDKQAI